MSSIKPEVVYKQSVGEEIANAITHGLGAALATAALIIMVVFAALRGGDAWKIVSLSIYGCSLMFMFGSSTLYHAIPVPRIKKYFQIMDHSAIFLLIAGTYTPVAIVSLGGAWGWTIFGITWGMAIAGIIFKMVFGMRYSKITVLFYLGMGWMAIVAIKPMIDNLPFGLLIWIAVGGLFYSFGIIFFAWEKLPFNHTIWHLFVLAGSTAHFIGILFYLV